MKTEHMNW